MAEAVHEIFSAVRVVRILFLHLCRLEQAELEQFLIGVRLRFLLPILVEFTDRGPGNACA